MTGPIRIRPGRFGSASVSGADSTAEAMLSRLGFAPPRDADGPLALSMSDGPLVFRAVLAEATRRLEGAGYEVEVDPQLRLSATGEEALEVLADLRDKLDELADVLGRIGDLSELADVAAQMVAGAHNVADGTRELLRSAAGYARDASGPPREREEIARWLDAGAESVAVFQHNASNVPRPPRARHLAGRPGAGRPLPVPGRPLSHDRPGQRRPRPASQLLLPENPSLTHPTHLSLAQRLRGLADQLDTDNGQPSQNLLRALVAPQGLLHLTHETAAAVRIDLDAWEQALSPDAASTHLHELRSRSAKVEDTVLASLEEAALHLPAASRLMADHAGPTEAAAAALAVEQSLWDGPEVRGNERVYYWHVEGSDDVPLPGLAPTRRGYADPYGTALFTRQVAKQVVANMLATDVGFEAAFQPDGSLLYTWPKEYDGDGGRMHVVPDDRGLYAIGGQWPWSYDRPGNTALAQRAQAARIVASMPAPSAQTEEAVRPSASATTPGRTR
ncbi:hypothetical protein ABTX81_01865 [Kitasatospora sp. NPDC097605]|uniref:hypothetical protein n=1 Tax=Kitasatospora sp. NPDC097605 TaxID=3157226 RepID=UPI0033305395